MRKRAYLCDYPPGAESALNALTTPACPSGIRFASVPLLQLTADFLALALSLPIDRASFYLLVAPQPCTVAWTVLWLATTYIGTHC